MRDGDIRGTSPTSVGLAGEGDVGGYIVRARRPEAWDAIVAVLTALDDEHPTTFHAVMQGCRSLSNSDPEVDGLDDLLSLPDQHLHDLTSAREQRRAQYGYAEAAEARAFLEMARRPAATTSDRNPVVSAYFQAIDEWSDVTRDGRPGSAHLRLPSEDAAGAGPSMSLAVAQAESMADILEVLWEAGVLPPTPRALLTVAEAEEGHAQPVGGLALQRLMRHAQGVDMAAWLARTREIAFLANVLVAGCSVQSRAFTLEDAADAAAAVCNLGVETAGDVPDGFLVQHDLIGVFEAGWRTLHHDVTMPVVDALIATLGRARYPDPTLAGELFVLRRGLIRHRNAGTPWLARESAEVLGLLDMATCVAISGLLSECPVVPAAMSALNDRGATRVDATAFTFFSTLRQIDDVRRFVRRRPELLTP